jgi:pimeloyl-ACP methyl ester carboxylesterase
MRGTILVEGGRIRCTDTGGGNPPVVLLHGDWTDSGVWAPVIPLVRDDFRVIAYDELGYGGSPPPTEVYTRLGNLRSLLDRLEAGRVTLVAHSGGANAALGLAIAEPDRVAALVLVAPGAHDYPWPEDDPFWAALGQRSMAGAGLRAHAAAQTVPRRRATETGAVRAARAQFRRAASAWEKTSVLCKDGPAVYERLDQVSAPTVVMVGEREYPMVETASRDFAARIGAATLTVVPGADHLLPLHSPAAVATTIRDVTG